MATTKKGNPKGEVHIGEGVDEKMKKLSKLFVQKKWSFTTEKHGVIDGPRLAAMATEQEADNLADATAHQTYLQVHDPVMRRNGERGAAYSAAHSMAMTAAKGNADLIKILKELKIRETKPKKKKKSEEKVG